MDFRFKPPLALLTAFLLVTTAFASSASADVVYEGFDYTDGTALASNNGGIGFGAAWTGGNFNVIPGLSSGDLDVVGGAVQRPSRSGNAATSRAISAASQTLLTADNSTIWFSTVLQGTGAPASSVGGTAGFSANTFGTLIFGSDGLSGGSGTAAAPISAGGSAIGVSFVGATTGNGGFPALEIQGVTYDGGTLTAGPDQLTVGGEAPVFVVGRVDFAANGSDDTLSLFHLTDGTAPLPTAFTTLTADLDQSTFDVVSIGDAQTSIFDEIRFGTTLASVTPEFFTAVPEPSSLMILGLSGVALLVRRRR